MSKLPPMLLLTAALAALSSSARADERTLAANDQPLSQQLSDLGSPSPGATPEPLYIVQDRVRSLGGVVEIAGGLGKNFNPNIYVDSSDVDLFLAYHWSDRFFAAASGSYVYNDLTTSGERIWDHDGIYPDTAFVKRRYDATLGVNLIYGKARLTRDSVFYFDQFVAAGAGLIEETNGITTVRVPAGVGDVGLAFSFGHRLSLRLGAKGYRFVEHRVETSGTVNHVVGYSTLGLLLGGAG